MRALFAEGKSVAEVTRLVPGVGYAFAYGVAKRAGVAQTAANRRPTRAVTVLAGGVVRIAVTTGFVTVHPDGTVKRSKS